MVCTQRTLVVMKKKSLGPDPSLFPSSSFDPSYDNMIQPRKPIPFPAFKMGWRDDRVLRRSLWVLRELCRVPSKPPVGWRRMWPRAVGLGVLGLHPRRVGGLGK